MEMTNSKKTILDLCAGTGAWSKPYKEAGYDVKVITLPEYDVRTYQPPENVYGILAAPPCDQFSRAKTTGEPRNLKQATEIVMACLNIIWLCQLELEKPFSKKTTLKFWVMENPNGMLKYFMGKPAFVFNPCDFGDPYKKETYLWGNFNEPEKHPVKPQQGEWDIHAKTGGKSERTKELRSITPQGFAKAFFDANQ